MEELQVPGASVAVIADGRVVWRRAFGYADPADGRPMTLDAVYRVESLSKPVTAWGVMTLVEEARVALDDPVEPHLAGFRLPQAGFDADGVTIRRLLSHAAGLPLGTIGVEFAPGEPMPTLEEALQREARLVAPPGSAFAYSNPGFNLLELLVERVTGEDFAGEMARRILEPLGMHDSRFAWTPEVEARLPAGHDLQGRRVPTYVYPERGAGGLLSTLEDMSRFVTAGMPRSSPGAVGILTDASMKEMHTVQVRGLEVYRLVADGYGLGHFVETLSDGRTAVFHGGQGHGWMTHMHWLPETGDGIVILTNSQRSWPLMARILRDWSAWRGFPPPGMVRILRADAGLVGLIALLLMAASAGALRVGRSVHRGDRRLAPLSGTRPTLRAAELVIGLGLAGLVAAGARADYLFLSSVFPHRMGWLAAAILAVALVLYASALFPLTENSDTPN